MHSNPVDVASLPFTDLKKGGAADVISMVRRLHTAKPDLREITLHANQFDTLRKAADTTGALMFGMCVLRRSPG